MEPPPYIAMVQRCEAAIVRIRAAIRAGKQHDDAVGQDYAMIRQSVTSRLTRSAMRVARFAPGAADEALDAMYDRLFEDVWSLTYVSLETQFGAYLNSMPKRVLYRIGRKYLSDNASLIVERIDANDEHAQSLYDTIADPHGQDPFMSIGERDELIAAIMQLPPAERHVILMRLQELENNAIAQQLGVSPATATRLYQHAVARLRQRLSGEE